MILNNKEYPLEVRDLLEFDTDPYRLPAKNIYYLKNFVIGNIMYDIVRVNDAEYCETYEEFDFFHVYYDRHDGNLLFEGTMSECRAWCEGEFYGRILSNENFQKQLEKDVRKVTNGEWPKEVSVIKQEW